MAKPRPKPRDPAIPAHDPLRRALLSVFSVREYTKLAQQARVGNAAAKAVLEGTFTAKKGSGRETLGRTRTLWNIWQLVQEQAGPFEETLAHHHIDPNDDAVRRELATLRQQVAAPTTSVTGETDLVVSRLLLRESGKRPTVRVGLVKWPPYWRQDYERCWTARYIRRLVGVLNPTWRIEIKQQTELIGGDAAAIYGSPSNLDILGIVYDTAYRRLQGMDIIRLPGIGARLGAIYARAGDLLTWNTIFDDAVQANERAHVVLVEGDIGHVYVVGARGYSEEADAVNPPFQVERAYDPGRLAETYKRKILEMPRRTVLFVADSLLCDLVYAKLRQEGDDFVRQERIGLLHDQVEDEIPGPVYPLGMVVPPRAKVWKAMLELGQTEELFENDFEHTAAEYAEIFMDVPGNVRPLPLTAQLPPHAARTFARKAVSLMQENWTSTRRNANVDVLRSRLQAIHRCGLAWDLWGPADTPEPLADDLNRLCPRWFQQLADAKL